MDIKQTGAGITQNANLRADRSAPAAPATPNATAAKPVVAAPAQELALSPEARKVAAALARVAELPVVDSAKVNKVKASVDDGSYTIDNDRLADNMLRIEGDLLERK